MDFDTISKIDDDFIRNEEIYKFFKEDERLKSKWGTVEKITTLGEIEKLIDSNSRVLDVGAATGVYSIPLSSKVKEVLAIEPSGNNFKILENKINELEIKNIKALNKSSLDMGELEDKIFDLVLLFGPMYHLSEEKDRSFTLEQAKRVVKDNGHILVAFINHDMVPITETSYNPNFFEEGAYNPTSQRLVNRPFIFFTLTECIDMLEKSGLVVEKKIASDGFSELLSSMINEMSDMAYKNYIDWHMSHCEKEELLGASSHFLFVCKKGD